MSGVSVRPRPRLPAAVRGDAPVAADRRPASMAAAGAAARPGTAVPRAYTSPAMHVTTTPAPKSTVVLEVELPPSASSTPSARPSRASPGGPGSPGFRPGKAPAASARAGPRPGRRPRRGGRAPRRRRLPRGARRGGHPARSPTPRSTSSRPRKASRSIFKATVPVRPEVSLGDYAGFQFRPEIEAIDDARVDQVIDELRDQNATLAPVEDRGAKDGDYAVIGFTGTRDGVAVRGRHRPSGCRSIIGEERLIPGFEDHLVGLSAGDTTAFDITFPDDYEEADAGRPGRPLRRSSCEELREKILPAARRRLRRERWATSRRSPTLRGTSGSGSSATPSTGPATASPTGSSSTPSRTPRSTCPTSSSTRRSR